MSGRDQFRCSMAVVAIFGAVAEQAFAANSDYSPEPQAKVRPAPTGPRTDRERVPIFFPPIPPPLNGPIPREQASRLAASPELVAYVGEIFYPPLGTRLVLNSVREKRREEIQRYRETRRFLGDELRALLRDLEAAEPARRQAELQALARRQESRLAELETTAERIREDLIGLGMDWGEFREWHLADDARRGYSPFEVAQVMRAYAYYEGDLDLVQRRLLREISIEISLAAETVDRAAVVQPHVFFSPELARVVLPADVPPELAARIASFQAKKAALKKELYDTVYADDGAWFRLLRRPLKALRAQQGPRFVELEALAEEIRRGLEQHIRPAPASRRAADASQPAHVREAYHQYRLAVFQPGLSAAQRRLLFDDAVEQLKLPLLGGALQPVNRTSRW